MINVEYYPPKKKIAKYRATCKCGCIFTYDENDKKTECFGHGSFWDIVYCPNCKNKIGAPWDESEIVRLH